WSSQPVGFSGPEQALRDATTRTYGPRDPAAFPVPNLSETEFSPYLSERRVASSAQNLSAGDLVRFRSLPPPKDRNTDELRQASLRSQSRRARRARVCWRKSLLVSLHHTSTRLKSSH